MKRMGSETFVRKKTPNITFGVFLLFFLLTALPLLSRDDTSNRTDRLMLDLFKEGNWQACRVECSRLSALHPNHHKALILKAVAELHSGIDSTPALKKVAASPDISADLADMARYELGREHWKRHEPTEALTYFKKVFENASSHDLFLRAGCSLSILLHEHKSLASERPALLTQLRSCYDLWTDDIIKSCRITSPKKKSSLASRPAKWIVAFYQSQISSAIGSRCSLDPSCSSYAMQSLNKHGALGIAMAGDRLVREPTVVAEQQHAVRDNGHVRYADPVSHHDWWMEAK
jgi:putative component of membrane protein insertase Oxa1/YidC/SpoIIIJ protein YidD